MLDRLVHLVVNRRRSVLAVSGVLLVAFIALALGAFSVLKDAGFDDPASDSSQANALLNDNFGGETNLVLLVTPTADGAKVNDPAVAAAAQSLTRQLSDRSDLTNVVSYWQGQSPGLRSKDGSAALITMHVTGDDAVSADTATELIDTFAKADGAIEVRAGGALGVGEDVGTQIGKDLALAESVAIPVTLILLLLAFGSAVAALLPLAIGLFAIAGTFAELNVLGHATDVSTYAINLTTALGLGLAIDYSLLIVSRFREELANGADVEGAIRTTLHTAGRTVIFSSATVAVALAAMVVFPLYFLRSFAYAGIGVVLIAMLTALVTLPALLATLGHRVNAGRLRRGRPVRSASQESVFWRRTATAVMRRPLTVALPVIAFLLLLGTPFLHISFGTPDDRVLPDTLQSRQVGDELRDGFDTSAASALYAVIEGNPSASSVSAYAREVSTLPGVTSVQGADGRWQDGTLTPAPSKQFTAAGVRYVVVSGPTDGSSPAAQDLVRDIRATAAPADTTVRLGGGPAELVDSKQAIGSRLPYALAWIALTTFVLLFLFTGSVLLPIKALALNALSLSAVFGAMVWIFQDGHLSSVLGFTPGPINTSMPVLLFCIAFGLSMDYEVFLLSRIKELHDQGVDTTEAVAAGLARTGRIVSTAAALLSVTFIAFTTSQVNFIQLFGLGTAIAIVLDATVIRGLLVPAFMQVAGEWNWWAPGPMRRLHRRIGLSEHAPPTAEPTSATVGAGER